MTDDPYRNARTAYRDLGLDFDEAEYLAASLRRIADHLTGKETP